MNLKVHIANRHPRARPEAGRAMHEAHAFAGHRIFVAAAEVEGGLSGGFRERGRDGHERMIAVENDPRLFLPGERAEIFDPAENASASEQDMADEDEVVLTASGSLEKAVAERLERFGGDRIDFEPTVFGPASELAPGRVEFAVAGEDAQFRRIGARAGRDEADEEIVGVGREDDGRRIGDAKLVRDIGLGLGPDRIHYLVPFHVGEAGGVLPAFDLPVERSVGPEMMAMRGEVEPPGRRFQAPREEALETHMSVRKSHSAGKARFSSVERRYAAPAEPPVPGFRPMIRSTVSMCL